MTQIIFQNEELILLSAPQAIPNTALPQYAYSTNTKNEPVIKVLNPKTGKWIMANKSPYKELLKKYNITASGTDKSNTLKDIYSAIVQNLKCESKDFAQVMNILMSVIICIKDDSFRQKWLESNKINSMVITDITDLDLGLDLGLDLSFNQNQQMNQNISLSPNKQIMKEIINDIVYILEGYNEKITNDGVMCQFSKLIALRNLRNPADCVKLIKQIYVSVKSDLNNPFILSDLFDLIKNMNSRDLKNNNNSNLEWTPIQICNYMAEQFKPYIIPNSTNKYLLLDPCCGSANLITAMYKEYLDKIGEIYEFEILPELIPLMKTNAIVAGYNDKTVIKMCDFMKIFKSDERKEMLPGMFEDVYKVQRLNGDVDILRFKPCHFGIINPPYQIGQNGNQYEAIQFINKMMDFCDVGVAIFPVQQFGNSTKWNTYKQELLNKCIIRKVINLGKVSFSSATVDVIISVVERREKYYPNDYYFNFNLNLNQNVNQPPLLNVIQDINQNINQNICQIYKTEFKKERGKTTYKKTSDTLIQEREINNVNEDWAKSNIAEVFDINSTKIKLMKMKHDELMKNELALFNNTLINNYQQEMKNIQDLDVGRFGIYKFGDVFDIIDKQKSHYTNEKSNGEYPLIGASKANNGIVGYLSNWDYENTFTIVKDGDGASGYVFYHPYKFSKVPTVYIMNLNKSINNFNIDINTKLLSIQLHPLFNHSNKLTKDKLNNLKIYLYI